MPHRDGVAVGRRGQSAGDARGAAGAGDVLDDDLLAQRLGHVIADDAGDDVGRSAGGEGHDHGDGPSRIGLRLCSAGKRQGRCGRKADG